MFREGPLIIAIVIVTITIEIPAGVLLREPYSLECAVINIHAALGEIGCVEVTLTIYRRAGQARVAGSVGGLDHGHGKRGRRCCPLSYRYAWVPSGNRPINGGEEKYGWFTCCEQ